MPNLARNQQTAKERKDAKAIRKAAADRIKGAFRSLTLAVASIETKPAPTDSEEQAVEDFAMEMAAAMTMADVYGRMRTLNEMRKASPAEAGENSQAFQALVEGPHRVIFAGEDDTESVVKWLNLPFMEAVESVQELEPMVADGFIEAAQAYSRMGFALARKTAVNISQELQRTQELRDVIAKAIEEGRGPQWVVDEAFDKDPEWDERYMRTVAATNMGSAYTAGRERQMRSPAVEPNIIAHRFVSALLPTTRANHRACHHFMAPPDHELWDVLSPLLGYNCYCRKHPVFRSQAKQFDLSISDHTGKMGNQVTRPAGGHADNASFGARSDKRMYNQRGTMMFGASTDEWRAVADLVLAHIRRTYG